MEHKSSSSPLGLTTYTDDNTTTKIGKYGNINPNSGIRSLFSRSDKNTNNHFAYGTEVDHKISVEDIVSYTESYTSMKLTYADFAYLTKLGVYPNNRLMVARRYSAPVHDDLVPIKIEPVATLISWVKDNDDFLSISYNEDWSASDDGSFKSVLNDIGKDVLSGDNKGGMLGNTLGAGANILPLPGWTEGLQYEVFKALGMTDLDSTKLPLGNPNLIRESSRRSTVGANNTGSGLKGKFQIKMDVEYEQKFISGVDPTTIYYDIVANALAFGTSESVFQFRSDTAIGDKFRDWLDDLGSGDGDRIKKSLLTFIKEVGNSMKKVGGEILGKFKSSNNNKSTPTSTDPAKQKDEANKAKDDANKQKNKDATNFWQQVLDVINKALAGIVSKYKIRIVAVANALTGTPSAPWHVTIGNPKRPILSCGDLICKDVTLTLGKVLAFNDLPSSIKITLTFESARNLGLQEIFKKMSCGGGRTYAKTSQNFLDKRKSFVEESWNPTTEDINASGASYSTSGRNNNPQPTINKK